MKTFLLIVYFCAAFSIFADERTITNKVENSKSLNTATNKEEMTGEQRLLAAFPQLSWSRAKLEFSFEMQAEIASALAAGANSDDEAFKWAKQMEAVFNKDDDIKKCLQKDGRCRGAYIRIRSIFPSLVTHCRASPVKFSCCLTETN
jgi:hypothetical protein